MINLIFTNIVQVLHRFISPTTHFPSSPIPQYSITPFSIDLNEPQYVLIYLENRIFVIRLVAS